jgi:transglutaminase-like putative cysteine protease
MVISKFWAQTLKFWPDIVENWINDRWPKASITYPTQHGIKHDVRNLVFSKSCILEPIAKGLKGKTDDETAMNCFRYVRSWLSYKGDIETHKEVEYWNDPEETFALRFGDCEDGGILLMTLMALAGIPAWKRKVCAGFVKADNSKVAGHAYVIYFRTDFFAWFVCDWCFWPSLTMDAWKEGVPHKELSQYFPKPDSIWFTFNETFSWAQHDTVVKW